MDGQVSLYILTSGRRTWRKESLARAGGDSLVGRGVIPCLEWSEREETFGQRPERGPGGSRAALGRTSQAAGTAHEKALRWVCAARVVAEAEEEGGTRGWWPWAGSKEGLRIILGALHTPFILSGVS